MAIVRWEPFGELMSLRQAMDQLVGESFVRPSQFLEMTGREAKPLIDVYQTPTEVVVKASLPGVKPEDVKIEVQDGVLTLSGQHEEHKEKQEKSYLRRERHYGSFTRTMALPDGVDPKKIKATTKDGVVQITIPLPSESKKDPVTITPTAA